MLNRAGIMRDQAAHITTFPQLIGDATGDIRDNHGGMVILSLAPA